MFELLLIMLERLGLIVMLAFIATRMRFFRDMLSPSELTRKQEYTAILFFGAFGIVGTYSGITFQAEPFLLQRLTTDVYNTEAIANFRVIGVVLAGLFGGYRVGAAAGVIAGGHRMMLGGFTGFACGIATIAAGIFAAWFRSRNPGVISKPLHVFAIGAAAEMMQMGLIVLLARPFTEALALVQHIALPMILANGIGCALFLLIIQSVAKEKEKAAAMQAQKVLRIAEQTLVHLKSGLTPQSATNVCSILYKELNLKGTEVKSADLTLSRIGENSDFLVTESLNSRDKVIGTVNFYFHSQITSLEKETLTGLANLLSSQLELGEADKLYKFAKDAEINALQAQINPHFLFNTLNTVISLVRINPEKARTALRALSKFIRQNLQSTTVSTNTLADEIEHIKSYLSIEQIRFEDRINVSYHIDDSCLHSKLPALTLQPIVENAVKHGFSEKISQCRLHITVEDSNDNVFLYIEDNGSGINEERLKTLASNIEESTDGNGIALYNINKRLEMTFGSDYGLQFKSQPDSGMSVYFKIPKVL
ncbi:LytS/YhcK type 5TM receptor domain-containing protein [Jeotgalicoccus psychrophilus]|uniref:LytS/YhcK type 5TM receptor domain-containing protein n=1 Tax=Jeotgalicoccus psychrophilus TaxID=157228 RepID=UPI0003F5D9E9|nr:LytS/YhcK type 5TM receptor domain-containing protein [Jeotgalicoccus psychrophilus]